MGNTNSSVNAINEQLKTNKAELIENINFQILRLNDALFAIENEDPVCQSGIIQHAPVINMGGSTYNTLLTIRKVVLNRNGSQI